MTSPAFAQSPYFSLCSALDPLTNGHPLGVIQYQTEGASQAWRPRQMQVLQNAPQVDVPVKGIVGLRRAAEWLQIGSMGCNWPDSDLSHACVQLRCISPTPIQSAQHQGWHIRTSQSALFATHHIVLPADGDCTAAVRHAYQALFELIRSQRHEHMVRIWNYVPRITHTNAHGREIYRDFNLGRSQAIEASGYDTSHMPAATGIGCEGQHIAIAVLASHERGVNFENPRQVSAFHYPDIHGPRPPSFARATAWPRQHKPSIFISGTAGIIGHHTVYIDDTLGQAQEALHNVGLLLAARQKQLSDIDLLTLYVRCAKDVKDVTQCVAQKLRPDAQLLVMQADICRENLLVEMEALVR